ncbi:hypothetical protein K2173_016317 [Erythroxylum novogranatense]|uniref:Uncharacterized protein n=1 Tax=Erythroxylum novogranatense TaxID=1862640 RepID=A0AAV8SFW0_9ROSI|nr:hypothetical protein K2173_016317 [Erythroxylum novogranatense]
MDSAIFHRETNCHVVAVPYPGRGHVNPMMNLCKLLTSKKHDIVITVVATEEWIGLIASNYEACQIRFASIPNVIPSELVRGADFPGFYEAVMTKMAEPFELLLDQLELPVTTIISDSELLWAIRIGNKRNIPVATLCTVPATVFSVFHHFSHLHNQQILVNLLENEDEMVCDVQGISSTHLADLRAIFHGYPRRVVQLTLECISWVPKAQFLLFNSVYELETHVFDALKEKSNLPIYPIGPAIPFLGSFHSSTNSTSPSSTNYFQWLDSQAAGSVFVRFIWELHCHIQGADGRNCGRTKE